MGRSAHSRRARLGRPAPAVEFWPGARWVYGSATQAEQYLDIHPLTATAF
jgi:hypothetical protein